MEAAERHALLHALPPPLLERLPARRRLQLLPEQKLLEQVWLPGPPQAEPPDVPRHVPRARLPLLVDAQEPPEELLQEVPGRPLPRHARQKKPPVPRQLVLLHPKQLAQAVPEQTAHGPPPVLLEQHQLRFLQLVLEKLPPRWRRVVAKVRRPRKDVDVGVLQPENVRRLS